jgi:hypothetical protein
MVQMEDVIAAEEATPEEPTDEEVDDYIDNSKEDEIDQGEEVTAYYTNFEQDSTNLRDSAILSREKADSILNEMFTGVSSDGDF